MTWKPSDGMSDKQIEKELQRQVVKFEDAVKEGQYYDSNIRFGDYGEDWLEMNRPPQLAPKTYECYRGYKRSAGRYQARKTSIPAFANVLQ